MDGTCDASMERIQNANRSLSMKTKRNDCADGTGDASMESKRNARGPA